VDLFVRVTDPAGQLPDVEMVGQEGERLRDFVARLQFALGKIDALAVHAGRRAGLEAIHADSQALQRSTDSPRRSFAGTAARRLGLARMHQGLQEGPRGEDHGRGAKYGVAADANTLYARRSSRRRLDHQVLDNFLPQVQVHLVFDNAFDFLLIAFLIGLRAGPMHGRPLAAVQQPELQPGRVDRSPHCAAERIDLADNLPLAHSADRRIAAHLADGIQAGGQQRGFCSHPRSRQSGFGSGVSRSDDNDIILVANRSH
jgi:hypothetical protein